MSAAFIPARLVPIARTDADWAFDILFEGEDWTGDEVSAAFGLQDGLASPFSISAQDPTAELACSIRVPASELGDKKTGLYTVEVRRTRGDMVDDVAVFELQLLQGISDLSAARRAPRAEGDGAASGGVIVMPGRTTVVRSGGLAGPPGAPGPGEAGLIAFNDTLTMLGVDNVQDAIVALYALIGSGPIDPPDPDPVGGAFDFSTPNNSALIGVL